MRTPSQAGEPSRDTSPQTVSNPPIPGSRSKSDIELYTRYEIHQYFWPDYENDPLATWIQGTLNPSAVKPDSVQFIVLYSGANPRWRSDRIIFVKTNLSLLGIDMSKWKVKFTDQSSNNEHHLNSTSPEHVCAPQTAVPVFEQIRRSQTDRCFFFSGFYQISKLDVLMPRSAALAKMLAQKWDNVRTSPARGRGAFWGRRPAAERDPQKWDESLRVPWAVIKFEKVSDNRMKELGLTIPHIEIREDQEQEHDVRTTSSKTPQNRVRA